MIELITGSPGAGKTTFAVAVRVAAECGRQVVTEDGDIVSRRVVVAGVRGLLLEHEVLPHRLTADEPTGEVVARYNAMRDDLPDTPVYQRLAGSAPDRECPCLVQNWWMWCKPGDLIVVDEVQFMAPRGSLGKKPPYWIEAMAVHRHYGVDFLIITQHPQLIDSFIRNLVGMHRHVRSMLGSALCTVYVWDHASNPERFSLANKGFFWRRAKHYRLFKSSVAHVKPPTSGRGMLMVLPVLVIGIWFGVSHMKSRFMGDGVPLASAVAASAARPALGGGAAAGSVRPAGYQDVPKVVGCYAVADLCTCVGERGRTVRVDRAMCLASASSYDGLVEWEPRKDQPVVPAYGASAAPSGGSAKGAVALPSLSAS